MDISPDKQSIDSVFSNTTFYIDFYQRQYKWNEEPVKRLLDDVLYKFNEEYKKHKDSDIPIDKLIDKFSWYYLNTYVTNLVEGKLFVVDGQQRLTTLTLMLIKLNHLAEHHQSDLKDWIKSKIMGQSGFKKEFWMNHTAHINVMQDLFEGKDPDKINVDSGVTAQNMVKNYKEISKALSDFATDKKIFETFVFYFLKRLVLINLDVKQTDVPMVFEVINDRGVKLKPYEILKGKLLGQIDKEELIELKINEIWDTQVKLINDFKEDEIDEFFKYFLKGKLSETRGLGQKFDKDYHRVMFEEEYDKILKLNHNPKGVKDFILNDFIYYTNLYARIYDYYNCFNEKQPYVFYNSLTQMDTQFLLILSVCELNDPKEEEKIYSISRNLDKIFCLLQLQRSYDSNAFATDIFKISSEIRNKSLEEIDTVFNKYLLEQLKRRAVQIEQEINYSLFKDTGIDLDKRFKRYFFARIEDFIATNTKMKMKQTINDLVLKTGSVNGFHIEHILSHNEENKALFNNDEDLFERERNRLGGLLILKGLDNISSGNEKFSKKLKTYSNTLYWNETLRADTYKSNTDFTKMIDQYKLNFKPYEQFGANELEERHALLFNIIKIIWS